MRILFGLGAMGSLLAAVCGCGNPEAKFCWSESTQDLLPAARKTAESYVQDRFGTPAKMVAWQRLPIAFGGVPGVITDMSRMAEDERLIAGLTVDFAVPALFAKYDANLDGLISLSELPAELQEAITPEKYEAADEDKDGFLTPAELGKLSRVDSPLFVTETISQVDEDNSQDLIGKELLFVDGRYAGQSTKVEGIDLESGLVRIRPPLSDEVGEGEPGVELEGNQVMLDFGRTMREGRQLYMRHCMHCHGVTGDGNGPTAKYLTPLPRDYRQGIFKFISTRTDTVKHPSREDLTRIIRNGIPGTYMPSFAMLKDREVKDIIEYVRWLSMRGEYEIQLNILLDEFHNEPVAEEIKRKVATYEADLKAGSVSKDKPPVTRESVRQDIENNLAEFIQDELPESIDSNADSISSTWREADLHANVIYPKTAKPPATAESIARGRQYFLSKCAVCHGATAEGNGENTRGYQKDPKGEEYPAPGFFDAWGQPIKPRDLNTGIYRGGRRPIDIYRRIHEGIPGTPMQAFAAAFPEDQQIWDLVDYVMSIPIDGPLPKETTKVSQEAAHKKGEEPSVAQSGASSAKNAE